MIFHKPLNANDYNVPQNRKRVFIVGTNGNKKFEFPKPFEYKPVLRDVLEDCPTSCGLKYNEKKYNLFKEIPQGGCWVDLPQEKAKEYLGNSYNSGGGKRGILKRLSQWINQV